MAELIIALDYPEAQPALAAARTLQGLPVWMKIGLELFTREGPSVVTALQQMQFKIMLDLKMFDIPNTVKGGILSACRLGVDLVTVHTLGGERMIRAAAGAIQESSTAGGTLPKLFGITVLTSMAPGELPGYTDNLGDLAEELAVRGQKWGLDGVVCSGHEVQRIKKRCPTLLCLTPGIRPASGFDDDQRRVMTPAQAVQAGSNYLVVGRPVTKAPHPAVAAREILAEINQVKSRDAQ